MTGEPVKPRTVEYTHLHPTMSSRVSPLLALTTLALLAAPLAACGGGDASTLDGDLEETGQPGILGRVQEMKGAMEKMQEAAEQPTADPVNFRQLRDQLPASLAGMERTNIEGATQGAMGFSVSEAEATYGGEEATVDIKITDLGAMPSLGMMGLGWTMADVDRETSTGYERTLTLAGNRGYRTYDTETRNGELSLVVAERFLVAVKGRGVDDDQLEEALRAVDLGALAEMRDEGRREA